MHVQALQKHDAIIVHFESLSNKGAEIIIRFAICV
jgi:hypothetical protein